MREPATGGKPLVLYDGYCAFCNGWVNFILRHERAAVYHFMPLQSTQAATLLQPFERDPTELTSVYVLEDGQLLERSDAALQVARRLRWPWRSLTILRWIPRTLRNAVYDLVGRWRYRLFGRSDYCAALTPAQRHRFLHASPPETDNR